MNLSTADLRNYRTEFHETWWSYRYMFLVGPKVFRFVVKGVKGWKRALGKVFLSRYPHLSVISLIHNPLILRSVFVFSCII